MISDEPDEDAADLDDEAILDRFVDGPSPAVKGGAGAGAALADWPVAPVTEVALTLDANTLAWFKTTHADWRRQMAFVLRAWVLANAVGPRLTADQ